MIMKSLDKIQRVKEEVENDLLKLPGVTGVGIGKKSVGGKETDELAIIVYVEEKKDVIHENMIPKQIQGIQTDVIVRRFVLHSGGKEKYKD